MYFLGKEDILKLHFEIIFIIMNASKKIMRR